MFIKALVLFKSEATIPSAILIQYNQVADTIEV